MCYQNVPVTVFPPESFVFKGIFNGFQSRSIGFEYNQNRTYTVLDLHIIVFLKLFVYYINTDFKSTCLDSFHQLVIFSGRIDIIPPARLFRCCREITVVFFISFIQIITCVNRKFDKVGKVRVCLKFSQINNVPETPHIPVGFCKVPDFHLFPV